MYNVLLEVLVENPAKEGEIHATKVAVEPPHSNNFCRNLLLGDSSEHRELSNYKINVMYMGQKA
jgi:hypothetical protein